MIEYEDAVSEMFAQFNNKWESEASGIVGYTPDVRWPGVSEGDVPVNKFWCRVSQQTVDEYQTGLSNGENNRYTTIGLIFVQLFCPRTVDSSYWNGRKLAKIARNAFRGHTTENKVWFRNARINELDPENAFYRFNIIAEYEYDQIG